ncbi:MAG TPA: type II toxin-antitoxin system HipA family toxin YjjJ [Gammaproteobacteria bacterium]|nr:type II toxin-antitoxin system HipA family toxin YjjJ [Gammaproteobacteria bacterium]
MAVTGEQLIQAIERRGIAYSHDLQSDLGASQATVSRLMRAAGKRIYRLGKGRNTRYSLLHPLFTVQPLYRIDPAGVPVQLAEVAPLIHDRYALQARRPEAWLNGLEGNGLFDNLPYFLDDLRPQGFLGRQIARHVGAPWPADPRRWSATQVLSYLIDHGADLPGDLVLGGRALANATRPPRETSVDDYPGLAEQVLGGSVPGSSAGGEQPKFTAFGPAGHVMVKFSPRGNGPEATRWRDILIAEHHAGQLLQTSGVAAADSRLHELDGRLFLEFARFDREGELGRRPMISLAAIDAEFAGEGHDWVATLRQLVQMKLVDATDLQTASRAQLFGQWTGNTDMHLGNLSFRPTLNGFSLLPVYDMAPMRWAPVRGELPGDTALTPPVREYGNEQAWLDAGLLASEYWRRLADEERLSATFQRIVSQVRQWLAARLANVTAG